MKSDALTPYPISSQSLRPLLRPCANEEQVHVCLIGTMPSPAHVASSHCATHIVISLKLRTADCILHGSKQVEI
jgi:hypothetical protein